MKPLQFMATTILVVIIIGSIIQQFSPFRTVSGSHDSGAVLQHSPLEPSGVACDASTAGRLLSIEELQQNANGVLAEYGEPTVTVDGKWGPMTDAAYRNAYSLQQAEKLTKDYYDTTR